MNLLNEPLRRYHGPMTTSNHYEILGISPVATQAEIKQAYRRLVKRFHPDKNLRAAVSSHDQIAQINAAYEVLGDPHHRQHYDNRLSLGAAPRQWPGSDCPSADGSTPGYPFRWTTEVQGRYQRQRQATQAADHHIQTWMKRVFTPVTDSLHQILDPLPGQVDQLAADPFDDQLMADFQAYLGTCRQSLAQAQRYFYSMPNPANLAGVAAHLYYCLNHVGDGVEELEYFTLNYDDHYLHTGQELFRIARSLQGEAEDVIRQSA